MKIFRKLLGYLFELFHEMVYILNSERNVVILNRPT